MGLRERITAKLRIFETILHRNLAEAQKLSTEAAASAWRSQVVADDAVASREYLNSIATRTMLAGNGRVVSEAYSNVIQAIIMEEGRRAGARMPPVDAIFEWLPYRGIEQKRSIAFAIALKIARDGMPARHIAEKTFRRHIPRALGDVHLAVAKSVHEFQALTL